MKLRDADEVAAMRAKIAKARAEKEEQRKIAISEKAKASPTYKDAAGNIVHYKPEIDPSHVGGFDELTRYLKANLKYPEGARENGHEGTVFVDFVILLITTPLEERPCESVQFAKIGIALTAVIFF